MAGLSTFVRGVHGSCGVHSPAGGPACLSFILEEGVTEAERMDGAYRLMPGPGYKCAFSKSESRVSTSQL